MADDVDIANQNMEKSLEALIRGAHRKVSSLPPYGLCYACGNEVEGLKLFCDGDCATVYEKRNGQ